MRLKRLHVALQGQAGPARRVQALQGLCGLHHGRKPVRVRCRERSRVPKLGDNAAQPVQVLRANWASPLNGELDQTSQDPEPGGFRLRRAAFPGAEEAGKDLWCAAGRPCAPHEAARQLEHAAPLHRDTAIQNLVEDPPQDLDQERCCGIGLPQGAQARGLAKKAADNLGVSLVARPVAEQPRQGPLRVYRHGSENASQSLGEGVLPREGGPVQGGHDGSLRRGLRHKRSERPPEVGEPP
mmetsp:Transcript_4956/g.17374  ORF Transcript_4956/g.17374 Transcript_4956/m.17374 type:complete len:240 (+) Transcript_4956:1935-2654(+)